MQFKLIIVLIDAIYIFFHCFLSVYTPYLWPISPMQCFYGPICSYVRQQLREEKLRWHHALILGHFGHHCSAYCKLTVKADSSSVGLVDESRAWGLYDACLTPDVPVVDVRPVHGPADIGRRLTDNRPGAELRSISLGWTASMLIYQLNLYRLSSYQQRARVQKTFKYSYVFCLQRRHDASNQRRLIGLRVKSICSINK